MSISVVATFLLVAGAVWWLCQRSRRLMPGPMPLPIIGNLHMLGSLPHRSLQRLSRKYGPIMSVQLGLVPAVVVSSPEAAELFLRTHDAVFAGRPHWQAADYLTYGCKSMGFNSYGPYWRRMRKLCMVELLSPAKLDSFAAMRRAEIESMVGVIKTAAAARDVVDVSGKVRELVENMSCKMMLGRSKGDRFDHKGAFREALEMLAANNLADLVPFLGPLDLQGLTRRLKAVSKSVDKILETVIIEHEADPSDGHPSDRDFVDTMLPLVNQSKTAQGDRSYMLDRSSMKAILLDLLIAGTDTPSSAVDWAISLLIRHPRVMNKLQEELKMVVGPDRMVEETDLLECKYLDMVLKESLRLYPVGPLLIPHESMDDIEINGYFIPKKSRILVNLWAIGRDPKVWSENCEEFLPERFADSNIDFRGHDFRFTPFGSGRRGCPGTNLGLITLRLAVGQLAHCFDWELPNGMLPSELDMSETFMLNIARAKPLLAIPTYRL